MDEEDKEPSAEVFGTVEDSSVILSVLVTTRCSVVLNPVGWLTDVEDSVAESNDTLLVVEVSYVTGVVSSVMEVVLEGDGAVVDEKTVEVSGVEDDELLDTVESVG